MQDSDASQIEFDEFLDDEAEEPSFDPALFEDDPEEYNRVKVKICGITNLADAIVAADAGADFLGFICYEKSPRFVEADVVRSIAEGLRIDRMLKGVYVPWLVGVFVNREVGGVLDFMAANGLTHAQLHGDEGEEDFEELGEFGYKALRPHTLEEALEDGIRFSRLSLTGGPDLLLDAYSPDAYGGTGERIDWDMAYKVARQCGFMMLAGGLTVENVAEAIRTVKPWAVDVSSGIEKSPGVKDHDKVRAFIAAAKAVDIW